MSSGKSVKRVGGMDSTITGIILFTSWILTVWQTGASPAFGPFVARTKELSHCENVQTEDLIRFDGRSTKVNKTSYFFSGNFTLKVPMSPDVNLHLHGARYGNGGWKDNYIILDMEDACESMKGIVPKIFEVFMKSIGNKTCPIQPGVYEVCDFPFSYFTPDISKVPSFEYGLYRGDAVFVKGGNNIGCHSFVIEVIPRKRKG